ncbi:Sulfotransferase domain-containing protein [Salinibacillus kushneri]|uniref:Sulfotransferase domain-containing protein n=1 Tax=Salinibacillus kushneri TaxID=237682 RepID=A0A1H9YR30_9BACI|nr:sulfotransferase [Salinibacillus kushneri]SES71602.1 Sulfotransferase domain-containing protein [Salinibacillus kushneri]
MTKRPVLISGIPRSGSTWLGNVLSKAPNAVYIHEPDNEKANAQAFFLKDGLHRYPYLRSNDNNSLYYKLWSSVLTDNIVHLKELSEIFRQPLPINPFNLEREIGKKSGFIHKDFFVQTSDRNKNNTVKTMGLPPFNSINSKTVPIVKSVHNMLSLQWLDNNFSTRIVIIVRHPASVISSYLKLKMPDSLRNIFYQDYLMEDYLFPFKEHLASANSHISQMSMQIGAFYYVLEKQIKNHPNWILVKHEDLCENPNGRFKEIYENLNLNWTNDVSNYIGQLNKKGNGYKINRIAKDQIFKYKNELSSNVIKEIQKYYTIFNNHLYQEF